MATSLLVGLAVLTLLVGPGYGEDVELRSQKEEIEITSNKFDGAADEDELEASDDLQILEFEPAERHDRYKCKETGNKCKQIGGVVKRNGTCKFGVAFKSSKKCDCCLPPRSCIFDGMDYSHGLVLKQCIELKCNDGCWEYTGSINEECGNCTFGGEPFVVYTFDNLENQPPSSGPINHYNTYDLNFAGDFSMVQPYFNDPASYGVLGHFNNNITCPDPYDFTNCITGITYYEPGITITLHIPPTTCGPPGTGTVCTIEVFVNGKNITISPNTPLSIYKPCSDYNTCKVDSFYGTNGAILVFRHDDIMNRDDVNCISIIGTKGLTAVLCQHPYGGDWWYNDPWAYVLAMPCLEHTPSLLYGLCNTFTGHNVNYYRVRDGSDYTAADCFTDPPDLYHEYIECYKFIQSWQV